MKNLLNGIKCLLKITVYSPRNTWYNIGYSFDFRGILKRKYLVKKSLVHSPSEMYFYNPNTRLLCQGNFSLVIDGPGNLPINGQLPLNAIFGYGRQKFCKVLAIIWRGVKTEAATFQWITRAASETCTWNGNGGAKDDRKVSETFSKQINRIMWGVFLYGATKHVYPRDS